MKELSRFTFLLPHLVTLRDTAPPWLYYLPLGCGSGSPFSVRALKTRRARTRLWRNQLWRRRGKGQDGCLRVVHRRRNSLKTEAVVFRSSLCNSLNWRAYSDLYGRQFLNQQERFSRGTVHVYTVDQDISLPGWSSRLPPELS